MFTSVVIVEVGPEQQAFIVHKDFLCNVSPFFAAALQGHFKEAEEDKVRLPVEDPKVFEYFLQWLYTKDLSHEELDLSPYLYTSNLSHKELNKSTGRSQWENMPPGRSQWEIPSFPDVFPLLRLYSIASVFQVTDLRDAIVDQLMFICKRTKYIPGPAQVQFVYEEIPQSNMLRQVILDACLFSRCSDVLGKDSQYPDEFMRDLCFHLKARLEGCSAPWATDAWCNYHEHSPGINVQCRKRQAM